MFLTLSVDLFYNTFDCFLYHHFRFWRSWHCVTDFLYLPLPLFHYFSPDFFTFLGSHFSFCSNLNLPLPRSDMVSPTWACSFAMSLAQSISLVCKDHKDSVPTPRCSLPWDHLNSCKYLSVKVSLTFIQSILLWIFLLLNSNYADKFYIKELLVLAW